MAKKPRHYDPRGTLDKVTSGDFKALDGVDALHAGMTAGALAPGWIGDTVIAPMAVAEGAITSRRDYEHISALLEEDLRHAEANPAIRKKVRELDNRAYERTKEYGSKAVGAGVGWVGAGALAGSMFGPVGTIAGLVVGSVGAMAGGTAASYLYEEALKTQDQDAVKLVTDLKEKGVIDVPPEVVFAALAANLPEGVGKRIEDRLEKLTGTRMFHEAVAKGKTKELQQLMSEFDDVVRADTMMPINPNNPRQSVSEQYAEMIKNGEMDIGALILHPERVPSLAAFNRHRAKEHGIDLLADVPADSNLRPSPLPGGTRGGRDLA